MGGPIGLPIFIYKHFNHVSEQITTHSNQTLQGSDKKQPLDP